MLKRESIDNMDLNERKKYTLKQLGFKVKAKKPCDPK